MSHCMLCGGNAVTSRQDNASRTIYNCEQCGVFVVSDLAVPDAGRCALELAAFMVSRRLMKKTDTVLISFDNAKQDKEYLQLTVEQIAAGFPRTFTELGDLVLQNLAALSSFPGDEIKVDTLDMAPLFWVKQKSYTALSFIIKSMQKAELIEVNYYASSFFPCGVIVSPKGWDRHAELGRGATGRTIAFVSSPHREEEWSDAFRKAVNAAARQCGLEVVESSTLDAESVVDNALIANVRKSSLVVCDLTYVTGEAYYTAGLAQSLGKVVALTCNVKGKKNLQLNASQMPVIFWDTQKRLYVELLSIIRAFVQ